ncbi:MAG: energy-coupling factor transporter transmembrane component T, partial [Deltaproteobacteria bacterium]|nr:energy-coupling factor transporter transmembrane component T [Deltaproteobacteria bacterium]
MKRSTFDPRSKLIVASVATVLLMIFNHWSFLTASLGILAVIVLFLHLGRPYLNFLKNLGFAGLTFFIIAWLAFDLITGIVSGLRLLTIGTAFFLFFQTTSTGMLSNGLLKMGLPYPFAFVLSASMQFVPVLIRRARNIRDAQRARGIPIEGGLGTLLHLPALAGPLLIQAFTFADELAEAMEARGFGISGRSFRYELRFRWRDWMAIAISLTALTIVLLIHF